MKQKNDNPVYDPANAATAHKLCLIGVDDEALAKFFGVTYDTIQHWRASDPDFDKCILNGRDLADAQVAAALYKRALGFHVMVDGKTKYFPPDVKAIELWMKNRQPNHWRDKQEPLAVVKKKREPTDEEIEAELPGLERAYEYAQRKMRENIEQSKYRDKPGTLNTVKKTTDPQGEPKHTLLPNLISYEDEQKRKTGKT